MRKVLAGIAAASVATALAVTVMSCTPKIEDEVPPIQFSAADSMYADTLRFVGRDGALPMFTAIADSVDKIVITNDDIKLTTNDRTENNRPLSGSFGPFGIATTKKKIQ